MSNAHILVLVHDLVCQPIKATVEYMTGKQRTFRKLDYDSALQRYVGKMEPGPYKLRIQGPKGTSEEHRDLVLAKGNNYVSVMVAPPGLPAISTPQGNWYFNTKANERMLYVTGNGAQEHTSAILKENGLDFKIVTSENNIRNDDIIFLVSISSEGADIEKLKLIATENLAKHGFNTRIAIPGYTDKELAFGLIDEIVIRFQSSVTIEEIASVAKRHSLQQLRHITWMGNAFLFRYPEGASMDLLDLVKDINEDPSVVFAEINLVNRLQNATCTPYIPNDYLYPETPHFHLIKADCAWKTIEGTPGLSDIKGGSPDVVVGILDLDGVDPTHPDLTDALPDGTENKQITNYDFVIMDKQLPTNCSGVHGTQCAGSAVGRFDNNIGNCGVAPNCKLIAGRLSSGASDLEIADIWVWMAGFPTNSLLPNFPDPPAQGTHIISNPWTPFKPRPINQTFREALDFLTTYPRNGRGIIMVFPIGNRGYECIDAGNPIINNYPPLSAHSKTLAIGASINTNPTTPINSYHADHQGYKTNLPAVIDTRSYFSPYGMTVDLVSPSHTCYDLYHPNAPEEGFVDPIMAPVLTGSGDWPQSADITTTLSEDVPAAANQLPVVLNSAFPLNEYVLIGDPGTPEAETTKITQKIGSDILKVDPITKKPHSAGTTVVWGPNNLAMNAKVGFGGTSHACATVAGAAALLLSVKPDLNWVEVRQILCDTAVPIDTGQTDLIGKWTLDTYGNYEFSQWYGYGRLDVDAAVSAAINLTLRSDAVVRDNLGDTGAVPSTGWHAESPDIWVRKTNDPIPALAYDDAPPHENPQFGQDNYVYLRVCNIGTEMAPVIFLRALITHFPGIEFQYPDDWQPTPRFGDTPTLPLEPGTYLIGECEVNNLAAGASTIVKMTWDQDLVPPKTVTVGGSTVNWHPCILAEAAPHDGPAIVTGLAYPVKGDNNIAHRNIAINYPATGGSSGLMNAVGVGTRDASGIDLLVIDRTALPADIGILLHTPDLSVMKRWIELVQSGRDILKAEPLGVARPKPIPVPEMLDDKFRERECCDITLLTNARLAVQCCDDDLLLIDAPRGTKFRKLCTGAGNAYLHDCVRVDSWQGQDVIRIDHGAGAIAFPLRLAANVWTPILVGTNIPNGTDRPRGRILLSQIRGDEQISPGYEIEV